MSMHLEHPSLSMSGKKKGKVKFRNAAEAQRARELDANWAELKKKWAPAELSKKVNASSTRSKLDDSYKLTTPPGRSTSTHIPSLDTAGGTASAAPAKVYTGTKMLGIGQLHKSNAVPVFCDQDAIDIARMRRG